jgi:hypothetical protein
VEDRVASGDALNEVAGSSKTALKQGATFSHVGIIFFTHFECILSLLHSFRACFQVVAAMVSILNSIVNRDEKKLNDFSGKVQTTLVSSVVLDGSDKFQCYERCQRQ